MAYTLYTESRRTIYLTRNVAVIRMLFFFFQAEDGIRDLTVTGVQTCALPILHAGDQSQSAARREDGGQYSGRTGGWNSGQFYLPHRRPCFVQDRSPEGDHGRDRKSVV